MFGGFFFKSGCFSLSWIDFFPLIFSRSTTKWKNHSFNPAAHDLPKSFHALRYKTKPNLSQTSFTGCSLQTQPQITNHISAKLMHQDQFAAKSTQKYCYHQLGSSQTFLEMPLGSWSITLDLLLPLRCICPDLSLQISRTWGIAAQACSHLSADTPT